MCSTPRIAGAICALLALAACVRSKEEPTEPTVLRVVPSELNAESWKAHDISIKVVCDLEATITLKDTPWAAISSNEITGSGQRTLTIALEANEGDEPRTGTLSASCGSSEVKALFTQLPLGSTLGVFNYDGEGASFVFDELRHQTSVRRYADGTTDSRILSPLDGKFVIFKGLDGSLKAGDHSGASLFSNAIPGMQSQRSVDFEVVKIADGKVWLSEGDILYIVRY